MGLKNALAVVMKILNLSLAILLTLGGISACSPSPKNKDSDTKILLPNKSQEDSRSSNNQPPSLTLASPSSTIFYEQARIQFSVKAKDADGTISKVVFFMDGSKLLERTSPPYTFDWTAIYGNHEITISAFDNLDVASASISKTINILKKQESNNSPTISIVSPLNNDTINEGETVYFDAIPEDTDGTIASVTFYLDGELYKTLTRPPYKTGWTATLGKHHLSVNAIDDKGFSSSVKQVGIDVTSKTKENLPPIISLLSPQPNDAFIAGDIITIEAAATDTDGSIKELAIFQNEELLSKTSTSTSKMTITATQGNHTFTITATDNQDLTQNKTINVLVNPQPNASDLLSDTVFPDTNLKACVHDQASTHQWTMQHEVTSLDCSKQNLTSTEGIEQLTQLKSLNLSHNLLTNASFSGLNQLTSLDLSFNLFKEKAQNVTNTLSSENYDGNILTQALTTPIKSAVIFIKDKNKSARFSIESIKSRMTGTIDSLIRTKSYNKEGIIQVDDYGWFELDSQAFETALQMSDWMSASPIIEAVNNNAMDLADYQLVLVIWDDTENKMLVNGEASPYKQPIAINQKNFGDKSLINIYLNDHDFDNQCFYETQNYGDPALCYNNPYGENLKKIDSLIFHEFLHTRELATHSVGLFCENFLLGVCSSNQYNMFDALSSARFFGVDLNAPYKNQINWLDDNRICPINDIGTYRVTLHELSYPGNVNNAIQIDYQYFSGFDIWLEYRLPSLFDYGLYNDAFKSVREGILIYKDDLLLDATPETAAINYTKPIDVGIYQPFYSEVLGLSIEIENVDQANRSIDVKITRTAPKPTRNVPSFTAGMKDCEWQGQCQIKQDGQMTTKIYQAGITDLGFGSNFNKPWKYTLMGLPVGITHTDTGIKRQYSSNPNSYSYNPHTFITFSASASVQPGTYNFTFRLEHPEDPTLYQDLPQVITVTL
jgi:hypothetical protein